MAGKGIKLVSGFVKIKEAKEWADANFVEALVIGDTDEEIRKNFRFSQTFRGRLNADERRKYEELEALGRVRLVSFHVIKQVGVTNS